MNYLSTNLDGKDWCGRQWNETTRYQEDNPNQLFLTYKSPLLAAFFNPIYEQYPNIRLWECAGVNGKSYDIRDEWKELAVVKEVPVVTPTFEQFVVFGIIASLNTITNQVFTTWAMNWLKNVDRTKDTAQQKSEELLNVMLTDEVCCGHAVVLAVAEENTSFAVSAVHRAYFTEPLDVEQVALLSMTQTPEAIGNLLS